MERNSKTTFSKKTFKYYQEPVITIIPSIYIYILHLDHGWLTTHEILLRHAIVSRNTERLQRILTTISRIPPCCPQVTSVDAGNSTYADLPTPPDNLESAVHDMSWATSLSNVESVIADTNANYDFSQFPSLLPQTFGK